MTVVRVYSEPGRIDAAARERLAEALTLAVLEVEVGNDSVAARRGIMVLFEDVPAERWAVGGRFDGTHVAEAGRLLVTTHAMQGVWTRERRRHLIERYYAAITDTLGIGEDRAALGTTWVLFAEIEEGSWGAWGGTISLLDLLDAGGFAEPQKDDARRLLGGAAGA